MDFPSASTLLDNEGSHQFRELCMSYGVANAKSTFKNPSMEDVPLALADDFARQLTAIGLDYFKRNPPGMAKSL